MKTIQLITLLLCFQSFAIKAIQAQSTRMYTNHNIGWYSVFSRLEFSNRWSVHGEFQWRRNQFIRESQQNLVRLGVNYHLNSRVFFRVGYGFIETYPYGEVPINAFGKQFTEHRIFEMMQFAHSELKLNFIHRYMLEQRFIGKYLNANASSEEEWPLSNRLRYMLRIQKSLTSDNRYYLAAFNEVMLGFGRNVQANIFDQNRIGLLFGSRITKNLTLELGYINQILQLGRQINGKNVFQNNKGISVSIFLNEQFKLKKK